MVRKTMKMLVVALIAAFAHVVGGGSRHADQDQASPQALVARRVRRAAGDHARSRCRRSRPRHGTRAKASGSAQKGTREEGAREAAAVDQAALKSPPARLTSRARPR